MAATSADTLASSVVELLATLRLPVVPILQYPDVHVLSPNEELQAVSAVQGMAQQWSCPLPLGALQKFAAHTIVPMHEASQSGRWGGWSAFHPCFASLDTLRWTVAQMHFEEGEVACLTGLLFAFFIAGRALAHGSAERPCDAGCNADAQEDPRNHGEEINRRILTRPPDYGLFSFRRTRP